MSVLKTYGSDTTSFKPSKTYRLDGGRIAGYVDNLEAVAQAIDLILSTERFKYWIYTSDYGVELESLIGKPRALIEGDIQRRIEEALAEDDRISGVEDFTIAFEGESAYIKFTVATIYGSLALERSVEIGQ